MSLQGKSGKGKGADERNGRADNGAREEDGRHEFTQPIFIRGFFFMIKWKCEVASILCGLDGGCGSDGHVVSNISLTKVFPCGAKVIDNVEEITP